MDSDSSLRGMEVSLTGRLASMKRAEAIRRITEAGGLHVDIPGNSTALLVAGQAGHLTPSGSVTRNLLRFRDLKQNGSPIRLIDEIEFLKLLGARDELSDFSRLYTLVQVEPDHRDADHRGTFLASQRPSPTGADN